MDINYVVNWYFVSFTEDKVIGFVNEALDTKYFTAHDRNSLSHYVPLERV